MERELVYDLPTRVFHWCFAGLFAAAFTIAQTIDDDSVVFTWHMLAGLTAGFLVLLRIVWGFTGTRHARFADFVLSPAELVRYFRAILGGAKRRWAGHNPASSWAALAMMTLALGLGTTGWFMASGDKETFEDIHELFANAFLIVVVLHVTGIVLHKLRHGEMLALSMLDGRKAAVPAGEAIASGRNIAGAMFLALVAGFGLVLWNNFDPGERALQLFGTTLQLGEAEDSGWMVEEEHEDEVREHD